MLRLRPDVTMQDIEASLSTKISLNEFLQARMIQISVFKYHTSISTLRLELKTGKYSLRDNATGMFMIIDEKTIIR